MPPPQSTSVSLPSFAPLPQASGQSPLFQAISQSFGPVGGAIGAVSLALVAKVTPARSATLIVTQPSTTAGPSTGLK